MKITIDSSIYPETLKAIPNSPKELYILGNENLLKEPCIAIIGSRVCTPEGVQIAEKFAKELSKENVCIVSGMAKGIDTAAHIGALKTGGKTIAVLGGGFNHIFPKENTQLFKEIIKNGGAVVSEYKENIQACSQGFILRNRIVSGLSMGVLVIEAKHRSGTSITADFARRQGRKVFCIPHSLEQKEGVGTNRLIKNGAILVTNTEDIMKNLKLDYQQENKEEIQVQINNVPEEYMPVYKYITNKPINVDELCKKTKLNASKVNYILTMLELEDYIKQLPGNQYIR